MKLFSALLISCLLMHHTVMEGVHLTAIAEPERTKKYSELTDWHQTVKDVDTALAGQPSKEKDAKVYSLVVEAANEMRRHEPWMKDQDVPTLLQSVLRWPLAQQQLVQDVLQVSLSCRGSEDVPGHFNKLAVHKIVPAVLADKGVLPRVLMPLILGYYQQGLEPKPLSSYTYIPRPVNRKLFLQGMSDITGVAALPDIQQVDEISLFACNVRSLPEELSKLHGLATLNLNGKINAIDLSEFPCEQILQWLPRLADLYLTGCRVKITPAFCDAVANMKFLRRLQLTNNQSIDQSTAEKLKAAWMNHNGLSLPTIENAAADAPASAPK